MATQTREKLQTGLFDDLSDVNNLSRIHKLAQMDPRELKKTMKSIKKHRLNNTLNSNMHRTLDTQNIPYDEHKFDGNRTFASNYKVIQEIRPDGKVSTL